MVRIFAVLLTVALLLAGPGPLSAASTGTTALHTPQGSGAGGANGDYVTASPGGLNTFYRYFIEVPAGVSRLVVEIWDPDIGRGGNADETNGRDRDRGGYDTDVDYDLIRPNGTVAASLNNCDDNTCSDNAWQTLLDSTTAANTAAGHWELRIDMTSAETGGDDINAFGIRAHDGTAGSGGAELNVYYDSQASFGVNPPGSGTASRSYTLYPYLTSGCSASKNDFDFDSGSGTTGSATFSSRTGGFSQSYANSSFSGNDAWRRDTFSGWTSDQLAGDYGIWTAGLTISSYTVGGSPNGNYGHLYMANYQAAANPPAANPTANAFRVYIATDAGAAPVKPYLEQILTHKSGSNPVSAGQTSRYQVTVRLVNPTAQSITFSASNLVTANIPGGGAVYAGNAAVGQGTIVSQPSIGGTGNITWNPGTVTAGTTTILTYQVDVSPTSGGQRIPVTATPASGNGTRAQFVDETGNTTQARSTFLFGPLCELAVTEALATQALVSSFALYEDEDGGVQVEWRTASETGTIGFHLHRWDAHTRRYQRVNDSLLLGLLHTAQGGVYRFVDREAPASGSLRYRIEEVEAGGQRRLHGPFTARVERQRGGPRPLRMEEGYERLPHPAPGRSRGLRLLAATGPEASVAASRSEEGVHLSIRETGLYRLSSAEIAVWLDLSEDKVEKLIGDGRLSLTRDGQQVAWYPDFSDPRQRRGSGLFFYGEPLDGLYSQAGVYRLGRDRGLLMEVGTVSAATAAPGGTFAEERRTERDLLPATVLALDPESDYWFWEFLLGGDPTHGHRTFPLDAPGPSPADGALLAVDLQGATSTGVVGEHEVEVHLNGTPLGETQWTGISAHRASFAVPPGLLLESGNQVEVTAAAGNGAPFSVTYVDGFDLSYRRRFEAAGDALAFTAEGSQVTASGFSGSGVRLLDVRDPLHPRWIEGAAVEAEAPSGYRLSFVPSLGARYLAAAPGALRSPAAVRPWSASGLLRSRNRAEYLVIAPSALREAAERLAASRQARGLDTLVVGLEEIYDEFNAGVPSPHAIRSFLSQAHESWRVPPRFVALAGAGTLDYRNLLGHGDNLLPPLMIQGAGGLFPSDNRLADVDGDGFPDMAVGRIPALTAAELDAYTAKIEAYEQAGAPEWARNVLLLADNDDGATDFAADSERVAAQLAAGYSAGRIYLPSTALPDARAQLLDGIANGASWINYLGHGGLDRLSAGGLLTSSDVAGMANGDRLPVLTAMTCTVNRFAVPGVPSLGEVLVQQPGGGAAAVWGPSGLADNAESKLLAELFYRQASETGQELLGERILRALRELRALGGDGSLLGIYNLLGDPALRVLPLPEDPVTNGTSGE